MNDEMKSLIEDAAKLLEINYQAIQGDGCCNVLGEIVFNPTDPKRGDLMKVADAAELLIDLEDCAVCLPHRIGVQVWYFTKGDHQSLALAILRAASAVVRSRG